MKFIIALLEKIENAVALPEDTHADRLAKASLALLVLPFVPASGLWSLMYYLLGLPVSAAIPGTYCVLTMGSLLLFFKTKRYGVFRFSQLLFMLLLPFLLQASLGGFTHGSAVMIWALMSPLGALTFAGRRQANFWVLGYVLLVVVSAVTEPLLPRAPLSDAVRTTFFMLNLGVVSLFAYFLMRYFIGENQREHDRAENLLLNILPAPIAMRLKKDASVIADGFSSVTVLFADIADFTTRSQQAEPAEIVQFLDDVFSRFDRLAERHGLEKIKTIGDCYMLASGIPRPREDHAHAVADMALDMIREVENIRDPRGREVDLRIGINSGAVVAGVIGKKKFIYDLWGDAVNTASRMESHGAAGRIHVTRESYDLLRDDYEFESRGTLDVKGKGPMETFFLGGRKPNAALDARSA